MANNLDKIYDASPDDINEYISELIFQNKINVEKGYRKLSGMLYGSPGIGKTESIEMFPTWSLERHNSAIASKYVNSFEFKYNLNSGISVIEQSKTQLNKTDFSEEIKKSILKDPEFKSDAFIGVVIVSQSDIIMPEDISGLPSSESDISRLNELYNLLISRETNATEKEKKNISIYKDLLNKRIDGTVANLLGDIEDLKDGITRNTTKFDYTEWEKKIWNIITSYTEEKSNIEHIILVLDDITRSANNNPGILNVLMPILQQAKVGQRDLPKNCTVVITSNEADDTDRNESNYVMELDDAQRDRVFSKKIKFNFKDWEAHSLRNDVHESVVLFFRHNPKYFKDHFITPRRATQLGQALFNKFGHEQTFVSDDAEANTEFMKTLHTQLGDSKNKNYLTIMTQFVSFLRTISSDTLLFITLLKEKGWNKEAKEMISKFKSAGELVKISIIVHKVRELASKTSLSEKQLGYIIDFFNDEILPINLRYTLMESNNQMLMAYEKIKSGAGDNDEKVKYNQIHKIAGACSKSIGAERSEIQKMAEKRIKEK